MASRGRGRGRGSSINIEALGLGREEILPAVAHPPPLYPPLQFKPVPLSQSEDLDYMLALKQELRESIHKSPFYVKAPIKIKDIERYSDKYQTGADDNVPGWEPDWTRFPHELKDHSKKKRKINEIIKPNVKVAKKIESDDVSKLLEKLEQNDVKTDDAEDADDKEGNEEEKKENKEGDGEDEDEEEYDEEDLEEETDYNQAYFDNGEGYGDDDEDDDEGPTY